MFPTRLRRYDRKGQTRTNFNTSVVALIREVFQCGLAVVPTELRDLARGVLGLAHGLDVRRVAVLVYGAEQAGRRAGDDELRNGSEGNDEESLGEHCC